MYAIAEGEHPVAAFHRWVAAIPHHAYPDQLAPVDGHHVKGVAAFPAGDGLYLPCGADPAVRPAFPVGGTMLVANHLDGVTKYHERVRTGRAHGDPCPDGSPTPYWRVLYGGLLDPAGVPRQDLFATNVHPALWAGGGSQGTVRRRGPVNVAWWALVTRLLAAQMRAMRPRVVAVLGNAPRRTCGELLNADLDAVGVADVTLPGGAPTRVVALLHPSARPVDVSARTYAGHTGRAADAALLAEAWHAT